MARVKVASRFDILKELRGLRHVGKTVGEKTIEQVREFTAKGISPVEGERRLARYKDPKNYPGDLKPRTPVNLRLTGDLMASLKFTVLKDGVRVFTNDKKALPLQMGTANMAARPFLPHSQGQKFNISIMRVIRDIYFRAIQSIIKKSNR